MGCILVKVCDPPLPDIAVRDFWHIGGVVLDGYPPAGANAKSLAERLRAGSSSLDVASAASATAGVPRRSSAVASCGADSLDEKQNCAGSSNGIAMQKQASAQKRPPGVLYVYNGRLVYRSRRCSFLSQNAKQLEIEICDVHDVKALSHFTSNKDGKVYSGSVVDINVANKSSIPFHVGFFTKEAEEVSRQLGDTCLRHRQKPKIFQFNSVDVDGVEIDLP